MPAPVLVSTAESPPETTPETVPFTEALIVVAALIATVPDNVPLAVKFTAPADAEPEPETDNGSGELTAAPTSNVAPLSTTVRCESPVLAPSALALATFTVPADTVVRPV